MSYNWRKSVSLTVLVCAAISASGCRAVVRLLAKSATQSSGDSAMNHYIDAYNELIDDPTDDAVDCLKAFPANGPEPSKKLRTTMHLNFSMNDLNKVQASIEKADGEDEGLETALKAAHDKLAAVSKACTSMHSYYKSEQFKDDAKGEKITGLFQEAVTAFKASRVSLKEADTKLQAYSDKKSKEELEEYDEDGFLYQYRYMMILAKKVVSAAKSGDTDAFVEATGNYETENAKLQKIEEKTGEHFKRQAVEFESLAQKYRRAIKEDKAKGAERLSKEGQELVTIYNSMVSSTDMFRQLEANGILKD